MNIYRFIDRMDIEYFVVARTMQSALMLYHDRNGASPVECSQINRGCCPVIVEQETNEPIKSEPPQLTGSEIQFHVFSCPKGDYDAVVSTASNVIPLPGIEEQSGETLKQTPNPFYTR